MESCSGCGTDFHPSAHMQGQGRSDGCPAEEATLVTYCLGPLRPDIHVTIGLCVGVTNSAEVFEESIQRSPEATEGATSDVEFSVRNSRGCTEQRETGERGGHTSALSGDSTGFSDRSPLPFSCWLCMNPASLVSVDQILLGVLRAVEHFEEGSMKTNDVKKEILYCASPSRNIAQALQHLGLQPDMCQLVLVMVQMSEEQQRRTCSRIKGAWLELAHMSELRDAKRISSFIHCTSDEEKLPGGLEAAVMGRIACKYI
ncbi:UNVERIFIED_CONTAM: kinase binding protein cgi-121 protein [Hammondia hammondi]|eukprot:XP_008886767.1 kinase binding protein cgi-121 protein [Hammondia hammondi]